MAKQCKNCLGREYTKTWQFPYKNGKIVAGVKQKDGRYSNGRLLKMPCIACNHWDTVKVEWTGPDFETEKDILAPALEENNG